MDIFTVAQKHISRVAMDISVEKTPKQKLSQYAVDTASSVSVTHLPGTDLSVVKDAAIALNDQAGSAKAVAHIGARNLQSESELHENCIAMRKAGVDKVLLIGGSTYQGKVFQTFYEVKDAIEAYGFDMYCGVYPQSETYGNMTFTKYMHFKGGISQLCFNPNILNQWESKTRYGVPTNCTLKGLYKYAKLCGLLDSLAYAVGNLAGIKYVSSKGFNTLKFVQDLRDNPIHLYNFGKLDQTLMQLEFKD